jgi:histidinol-phosphate phosphatase family protein
VTGPPPGDVFLDRDGVIIRNRSDYVKSWDEVELLPGAVAALARLATAGHRAIVVTNQSAIARRLVSAATVDAIHHRLGRLVERAGGRISAYYICPHGPEEGCACRKPRPGLLLQAQREMGVDLSTAYVIGDQIIDMQASRAAGCTGVLVKTSDAPHTEDDPAGGYVVARDIGAAVDIVLSTPRQPAP